jgi:hypothetical protein
MIPNLTVEESQVRWQSSACILLGAGCPQRATIEETTPWGDHTKPKALFQARLPNLTNPPFKRVNSKFWQNKQEFKKGALTHGVKIVLL